jgi:hypothetical protein
MNSFLKTFLVLASIFFVGGMSFYIYDSGIISAAGPNSNVRGGGSATNSNVKIRGGSSGGASITVGSTASNSYTNGSDPITFSYTVAAGSDRLLFVVVGHGGNPIANCSITSVTYNGDSLTEAWDVDDANWTRNEGWYMVAPDVGTANIVVDIDNSFNCFQQAIGATTFTGVNQVTPIDTPNTNSSSANNTPSVTISSAVGDVVIAGVSTDSEGGITEGGSLLWEIEALVTDTSFGAQYYSGASSVNATWTAVQNGWAAGGVSLNPAGGSSGSVKFR